VKHGRSGARSGLTRRGLFRLAGAAASGAIVGRAAMARRSSARPAGGAVVDVLPDCAGCTGCVAVCPTGAIEVTPRGISIRDDLCDACGYCVTVCPVEGVHVRRRPK
jgi:ferredoxin